MNQNKPCTTHFVRNCPLCSQIEQAPSALPVPSVPLEGISAPQSAAPSPPPSVSDPKIQKRIEAARRYAQSVETAAILEDQVKQAMELLAALKLKLEEAQKDIETTLQETKE